MSVPDPYLTNEYSLVFLGTGTSIGIPVPGCHCRVCQSTDIRDQRWRSSVLLRSGDISILIDTAPEFRLQALSAKIDNLDAVFWTHSHADHLHGLDDLRALTWKAPLPGYANRQTIEEIQTRFEYLWATTQKGGGKARVDLHIVERNDRVKVGNLSMIPIPLIHGRLPIFGWRCGPVAYLTDASVIPPDSYPLLEDLEILVLNGLNFNDRHPTHFSIGNALKEIEKIKPEKAYLTHFSHEVLHNEIIEFLPNNVVPAYDGLTVRTGEGK